MARGHSTVRRRRHKLSPITITGEGYTPRSSSTGSTPGRPPLRKQASWMVGKSKAAEPQPSGGWLKPLQITPKSPAVTKPLQLCPTAAQTPGAEVAGTAPSTHVKALSKERYPRHRMSVPPDKVSWQVKKFACLPWSLRHFEYLERC